MGGSIEVETETLESEETDGPKLAICLVSGGMDSCVTAAIAHEENDEIAFLHVSYTRTTGQNRRLITHRQLYSSYSSRSFRARNSFELRSF
jgi:tRNA(Ile)-lysidine synthase TilS/MesJ